jgi:hypothetical protein
VNPPGTRRLEVTCDHITRALQSVRRLDGIQAATVFGQSMHLLVDDSLSEEIIRDRLRAENIQHAEIRAIAPSLEDVFVALTDKHSPQHA